jgi:hypothetical protein
MYLLMSAFHAAPWRKRIRAGQAVPRRALEMAALGTVLPYAEWRVTAEVRTWAADHYLTQAGTMNRPIPNGSCSGTPAAHGWALDGTA